MISRIILAVLLLLGATPAYAGPFAAIIPIIIGAVVKSVVVKILLTVVLSVAVSALQKALSGQKKQLPPGIQTERRLTGGTVSRTILFGYYATAGSEVCPPMSFGNVNKTPNAYLTTVTALSDVPIDSLRRIIVNGEYCDIGGNATEFGLPIGGKYSGKGWVKFYDGRQTVADPYLVSRYSNYVRPWTSAKVGTGMSYAIVTWLYDADIFKGEPEVKFELYGMRLYDPRKDTTVGGVGSHRFNDANTWELSFNNIVMVYNILRGILFVDGSKYGGECSALDLPLDNWAAAMNVCDETVTTSAGDEPRYRAGFEVSVAELEPADAIEELLKGCSGQIVEAGGVYKVRCGPPSLPVVFITDGEFLVSEPSDFDPFPGINVSKNTLYASYPSPDETWNTHDAPVQSNPVWLARDQGVELSASLTLPAVPYPFQVQRLMLAWLKDDQRWRQHSASFGHYGFALEPLDTIAWTSARNQYNNKLFEVSGCTENLVTLRNTVALREVDPDDYHYVVSDELPDPVTPGAWDLPVKQYVPGFGVTGTSIKDTNGVDRRAALLVYWSADAADDADFIKLQIRLFGHTETIDLTANIQEGSRIISEGILPSSTYQARGKFIADRPTDWTDWYTTTTGNVKLTDLDIAGYNQLQNDTANALTAIAAANADIATIDNQIVTLQGQASDAQNTAHQALDAIQDASANATQAKSVAADAQTKAQQALDGIQGAAADATQAKSDASSALGRANDAISQVQAAGGQIATLQTLTSTQGAAIAMNSTAISNTRGDLATLTTRVSAGSNPNLIPNGGFENGLNSWNYTVPINISKSGVWGNYAVIASPINGNGEQVILQTYPFDFVSFGQAFTLACDLHIFSNSNQSYSYVDMLFFDANGNDIPNNDSGQSPVYANRDFSSDGSGRALTKTTFVPPSNAAKCIVRFVTNPAGGTISSTGVRLLKMEAGNIATPYSTEATITQTYQVLSTLNTQYASLSTTVSVQGASITNNATAINSLGTTVASLSSTVTAQGATITTNAQAIGTLNSQYASLSSTVGTQGASITQNATAISNLGSTVANLSSTVSTQGASISSNATAISNLLGNVATLITTVNATGNLLQNTDFAANLTGWSFAQSGASYTGSRDLLGDGYRPKNEHTIGLYQSNNNQSDIGFWQSTAIPVQPGKIYEASCGMANARAKLILYLRFMRSDGSIAGDFTINKNTYSEGNNLVNFPTSFIRGTAPADAQSAVIILYKGSTDAGYGDSYAWFVRPQIVQVATIDGGPVYYSVGGNGVVVSQQFTALSDINQQYASLSSTVSTQGASITSNANAITNLNGQYASLSSTVSAQGATITSNAQAISTLNTQYASLSQTVSTQGASITQNATAINNLGSTVASLSSTVSAQGSQISTNATAISNVAGNLATLTTRVSAAGNPNLLSNGSFENGLKGWNVAGPGGWSSLKSGGWGQIAATYTSPDDGQFTYLYSDIIGIFPGAAYTLSADAAVFGNGQIQVYLEIDWYASDGTTFISGVSGPVRNASFDFSQYGDGRSALQFSASSPSNANFARVLIVIRKLNGTLTSGNVRQIKLEQGNIATPYSSEASVTTTYQALSTIDQQYASLSSTVSVQGASITNNANAISNINGQYATLSSTVSAQGSQISSNAQAINTTNDRLATLTTRVSAGNPNLIPNGGFENGLSGWDYYSTIGLSTGGNWGNYAAISSQLTGGAVVLLSSKPFTVSPNVQYTLTADAVLFSNTNASNLYVDMIFVDGNNNVVPGGDSDQSPLYASFDFSPTGANRARLKTTFTAPSGTVKCIVRLVVDPAGGTVTAAGARLFKMEVGSVATPYSSEASAVQSFQAISTVNQQYASLSSTVSAQGASITQNAQALSTLGGQYASLSSTVGVQGASITSNAQAISTTQGNVTTLFARTAVRLDVNGYVIGWEQNNNGSYGEFTINADHFAIVKPGGGARTEYSAGNWRVYDANGVLRVRMGVWS